MNKHLLKAICADPVIGPFLRNLTPDESRRVGMKIIQEQAKRHGISEIAAMKRLAPHWIATREQARDVDASLVEHLSVLIKMCD